MNDHAGWSKSGICIARGSWNASDPCIPTPDAMWRKIEILWNLSRELDHDLNILLRKVDSLL